MTVRAIVAARRKEVAIVVEAQNERAAATWRGRPIVAAVTDTAQAAIEAVATPRSRIPDGGSTAELAGEVHAFIGAVICIVKRRR